MQLVSTLENNWSIKFVLWIKVSFCIYRGMDIAFQLQLHRINVLLVFIQFIHFLSFHGLACWLIDKKKRKCLRLELNGFFNGSRFLFLFIFRCCTIWASAATGQWIDSQTSTYYQSFFVTINSLMYHLLRKCNENDDDMINIFQKHKREFCSASKRLKQKMRFKPRTVLLARVATTGLATQNITRVNNRPLFLGKNLNGLLLSGFIIILCFIFFHFLSMWDLNTVLLNTPICGKKCP